MAWDAATIAAWAQVIAPIIQSYTNRRDGVGKPKFVRKPDTPEERAIREYGSRIGGLPGANGQPQAGALPTLSYLGPQIHNILQNNAANAGAYRPLDLINPTTGAFVPSAAPPRVPFDFSSVPQPWPGGGPGSATGTPPRQVGDAPRPGSPVYENEGAGSGATGQDRHDIGGTGDAFPLGARLPETWGGRNVITPGNYPGVTNPNTPNPFVGPGATFGPNAPGGGTPGTGNTLPTARGYETNFNDVFSRPSPPPQLNVDQSTWSRIVAGWNAWRAVTPGWVDNTISVIVSGVAAGAGLPPMVVAPVIRWIMGGNNNGAGAPPSSGGGGTVPGSISGGAGNWGRP